MRESGRISLIALGSIVCVILTATLLLFSRETPSMAAAKFIAALDAHDVNTLTKMSMMSGTSEESIRKQWDFCVNTAEKYYRFSARVEEASQPSPTTASVKIGMTRDWDHPGSYEEQTELPLVKVGDEWKVDVRALSREFFNCLPR